MQIVCGFFHVKISGTMPNNFGSLLGKNFENGDINGASNGE